MAGIAATNSSALVKQRVRETLTTLELLLEPATVDDIDRAARTISGTFARGGKLLLFGNGGSAADAQHIAAEFLGRYLCERESLPALALPDNGAAITAIGNDYTFADVFARQVRGLARPGDCALAISTSGNSANVVAGARAARERGVEVIGLTGRSGAKLADVVDVCIRVESSDTPRVQEGHHLVGHILCELVERDVVSARASA